MAGRRAEVLSSYRNLLRACRETFSGDYPALAAAFSQARDAFERARHESSDESIQNKVSEAFEAISFLRSNIVQASSAPSPLPPSRLSSH